METYNRQKTAPSLRNQSSFILHFACKIDVPPAACTARLPVFTASINAASGSLSASHRAKKPALNASPAPVVSTTLTLGA